jgi:NADH dehydrogenase FAD-containing subunit
MARVLILGGGFAGVVAAESLINKLGDHHQVTLVSRSQDFVFYPGLVRLAFNKCTPNDISFDLRETLLGRRVNFVEAEVARIDLESRRVITAHGDVEGSLPYDYLIYALGRRLATERVSGFYENAHHVLTVPGALKFGAAIRNFSEGHAVFGECPGARLSVPVYEAAFFLARELEERGTRNKVKITIVSPDSPGFQFGDASVAKALRTALEKHNIAFLPDFPIETISPGAVLTSNGHHVLKARLLMLIPPFCGSGPALHMGLSNNDGYIQVDDRMRVEGVERVYAAGDSVNFSGPKMGHMAVHQAETAAANVAAEIKGLEPTAIYNHELMLVIDEGGSDSIYVHKFLAANEPTIVRQGRLWQWAKRAHEKYWQLTHS